METLKVLKMIFILRKMVLLGKKNWNLYFVSVNTIIIIIIQKNLKQMTI